MYAFLADHLWERANHQGSPRGHLLTVQGPSCSGGAAACDSIRPWGELPECVLSQLLRTCHRSDAVSIRSVCSRWHQAHLSVPLSLTPSVLNTASILKAAPRVTSLNLSSTTGLADVDLFSLALLPHLQVLILRGCGDITASTLTAVAHLPALTELDLSETRVNDDTLLALATSRPKLMAVSLDSCHDVSTYGLQAIVALPTLSSLSLRACAPHSNETGSALAQAAMSSGSCALTSLSLQGWAELTSDGIRALSSLTALRSLNLSGCSALEGEETTDSLAFLTALQHLDLSHCNKLSDSALRRLAALSNLEGLHLAMCNWLSDSTLEALSSAMPGLSSLSLSWCERITNSGLASVVNSPACASLSALNLSGCSAVTNDGLWALARLPRLSVLRLSHCKGITGEGLEAVSTMKGITTLCLSSVPLLCAASLRSLTGLRHLENLELGGCKGADDEAMAALAGLGVPLRTLAMPRCPSITDQGLRSLRTLSGIRSLDLRRCRRFTENALLVLFAVLPHLDMVDARECYQIKDRQTLMEKAACKGVHLIV